MTIKIRMRAGERKSVARFREEFHSPRLMAGLMYRFAAMVLPAVLLAAFGIIAVEHGHAVVQYLGSSHHLSTGMMTLAPLAGLVAGRSNIHGLRQRKIDLTKAQRSVLDKLAAEERDFTAEEDSTYKANAEKLSGIERLLEREEGVLEAERNLAGTDHPDTIAAHAAGAPSNQKPGFGNFGEFLQAVVKAERSNGRVMDQRLNLQAAASGASEAVPADGGFLVQQDFASEILTRAFDGGEILKRVRKTNVSGNGLKMNAVDETSRATGSRWGGVQAYWANEADTVTAKKPKFRQMNLTLHKLFALFYATDELIEDASAFSTIANQAFAEELTFMAEDAIWEGDGAGKPLGLMNGAALVTVSKETQAADTVIAENVLKMNARMPARSLANAVWFTNVEVLPQLPQLNIKIKNNAGTENVGGISTPIYQFPANGGPGTILGKPVIPVEYASAIGDLGDLVLADLSQYQLIQKAGGVQTASSMHVRFLNDEMVFRLTFRLDGQPIWNSALTPFKGASTLSPFVTLQAR